MNKSISKIVGASLAIAMMVGVGIAASKQGKQVYADPGDIVATFDSDVVVSNSGYQEYTNDDWKLSKGGNNKSCGWNKSNWATVSDQGYTKYVDGTVVTSAHYAWVAATKNALSNVAGFDFIHNSGTSNNKFTSGKLYLTYSTDGNTYSLVTLTSGTQGTVTANNTSISYSFDTISSAYFAIIATHGTSGRPSANDIFRYDSVVCNFYEGASGGEQQNAITSVSLTPTSLNLDLYDSASGSLTATVGKIGNPSIDLTAESSNESVATISTTSPTSGTPFTVTAHAEGNAIITVTSVADNTKLATCNVTVVDSTPEPFVPKQYALCTSTSDLEVGARYIFTNGTEGDVKAMSTESNNNNRRETSVTVDSNTNRITSTEATLVVELGGSENSWTFETINYLGTNGYFASNGTSNHLKVQATAGEATIGFSDDEAIVHLGPSTTNYSLRYNTAGLFSCYSSGQNPIYLWKEYKVLSRLNITGAPTKLSGYYESEAFDPTGITAYEVEYEDSSTKALTASDIKWPDLVANMGTIKGSYTEFGQKVYTPEYNISVSPDAVTDISLSGTMGASYLLTDSWNQGSLAATAIYATGKQNVVTNDATFTYYSDSALTNQVATPADLGAGENQKVYVKATYQGVSNTTGYEQTVSVTVEHGSVPNDPLTADEAIAMGAALPNNGSKTEREYYISGMVYSVTTDQLDQEGEEQYATFVYDDSDPGKHFQAYKIKPATGCTGLNELRRGAVVVLKTKIYRLYSGVIENDDDGEIISISYNPVELNSILIKPGQLDLTIGGTYGLDPVPYPLNGEMNNTYWFVQDPSIVSVDANGVVKALKEGFTRVFYFANGMSSDSCKIHVYSGATLDLSTDTTKSASEDAVNWEVPGKFTMDLAKGESQSNANAYYPGVNNYTSTRFYKDQVLTFTPDVTLSIAKVELKATSSSYATTLGLSQGLVNATASCDDTIVTIRPTDGTLPFSITPSGACGFTSVKVFYTSSTEFDDYMINSSSIATVTGDEDAEHNATNLGLVFGARIRQSDWNAIEKVFGEITDYGMMFVKRESLDEYPIKTIAGSFTQHSQMAVVHKGSGEAPQEDGSDYIFSARINITSASNYDTVFVGAPFIVAGGTYYFLPEIEYSLRNLAEYCFDHDGCGSNLSAEALLNVATM